MISISFITELELLCAKQYTAAQTELINAVIENMEVYTYNNLIKQSCISFRQKYSLKLPDAIIAAIAFVYNLPLFTADKDFTKIKEIQISLYTI